MSANFQFDTRPEVDVVVYRHRGDCRFPLKKRRALPLPQAPVRAPHPCPHQRQDEIVGNRPQRAKEWADNHDPVILRERAREADNAITPKGIEEAFDEFIATKEAASANPHGYETTKTKYNTMKKQLVDFLNIHNQGRPDAERVLYVHQITSPLLNKWMGTWKSKTYWSKSKKRDNTIAFFDHCIAQKWIRATLDKVAATRPEGWRKLSEGKDPQHSHAALHSRAISKPCCGPAPCTIFRLQRSK